MSRPANDRPLLAEILSPRGLLIRAAVISGLFVVGHLAGWREYTTVLCGTPPTAQGFAGLASFLGLVYVLAFVLFAVVVPILIVAAGFLWVHSLWRRGHERP